jgi:hypothetical protein
MLSVVHSSDCPKLEFIQPHLLFVTGMDNGCLDLTQVGTLFRSVRLICQATDQTGKSDASERRPYLK